MLCSGVVLRRPAREICLCSSSSSVQCINFKLYYAVHAFAHVHTFAHSHRFGSIDTFQFTFLLKKKTIDKVTIIDKES